MIETLNRDQKKTLAEKLMDLGNFSAVALLLQQALSDEPFSLSLAALGLFLLVVAYFFAVLLMRKGTKIKKDEREKKKPKKITLL